MKVFCFSTGFPPEPYAEKMYIIYCEKTLDAVIVDPGVESFGMALEAIQQHSMKPVAIWLTHSHWDHIVDVAKIKREFSIPIYIHEEDRGNLEKPGSDGVPIAIPTVEEATPDNLIKDKDILTVGKSSFSVIHTPGHSPGSVCFYCEKENILLSGDTIYRGLIGATSLSTGQPEQMWLSLDKLATLPLTTAVFPGHGPSTTIKEESWLPKAKEMGVVHVYT